MVAYGELPVPENLSKRIRAGLLSRPNSQFLQIQACLGLAIVSIERLFWWEPLVAQFKTDEDLIDWIQGGALLLILVLNVLYASNSAVWSVFGDGRHFVRFSTPFVLHQFFLCSLLMLISFRSEAINRDDDVSVWAATTGVYLVHWIIMVAVLSVMRSLGLRLFYLDRVASSGLGPREEDQVRSDPSGEMLCSDRYSISDLLALTAWIAFLCAAAIRVYQFIYREPGREVYYLGRDFTFIVTSTSLALVAAVSQLTMIPSLWIAMIAPRKRRKNLFLQSILLLHFIVWIILLNQMNFLEDEGFVIACVGLFFFITFQIIFTWMGHRQRLWLPFRFKRRLERVA